MRHLINIVTFTLLLGSLQPSAHSHIDHAEPAKGSTVQPAPPQVTLTFSEKIEPAFSSIEVRNAAGARVDQGKVTVSGITMSIGLTTLPAGIYTVS